MSVEPLEFGTLDRLRWLNHRSLLERMGHVIPVWGHFECESTGVLPMEPD